MNLCVWGLWLYAFVCVYLRMLFFTSDSVHMIIEFVWLRFCAFVFVVVVVVVVVVVCMCLCL